MIGKMPGETLEQKAANLRAAYGFYMGHPGKKLLFMGQDFAQVDEWNENASLEWNLLQYPLHSQMQEFVKDLNGLYAGHPALSQLDYDPDGFEWINCSYHELSMVMFVRKTKKPEETLLFVCNFDNMAYQKFRMGVPFAGKYKEILNSDAKKYGGSGMVNARMKSSKKMEWDEKENSIEINIAPMSVSVFTCTPAPEKAAKKTAAKKESEPKKKTAAKKAVEPRKTAVAKKESEPKKETAAKKAAEPKKPAAPRKAPDRKTKAAGTK